MNYGSVTFEEREYKLQEQAYITGRIFPINNWHEVSDGEEFTFEMTASAVDEKGNEYNVYWVFTDVKGDQKELDGFNYNDVDRVESIE